MRWPLTRCKGADALDGIKFTKDFYLLCMSSVYLFAFASLYHQIPGLFGNNGILPVRAILKRDGRSFEECMTDKPSILWFASDLGLDPATMMEVVALVGVLVSFLAIIAQRLRDSLTFLVLWVLYFSLYQVGQIFFWYQWDILLLEAGFLTILVAPLNLLRKRKTITHTHDAINFWLVRWLLFRLMFASGVVKLTSMCPTWWGLTALHYHFESQCIPTPFAWFAHHLPEWFLKLGVVGTFLIEIPVPLLFFSPVRSLRLFSFYCQVFFQMSIIITGNYNFFNLLTLVLCVSLIDDDFFADTVIISEGYFMNSPKLQVLVWILRKLFVWFVYLALGYWTMALFGLKLKPDFTIQSDIAFTQQQFQRILLKAIEFTIWIGATCLIMVILQCLYKSVVKEKKWMAKLKASLGTFFFGFLALGIFSISVIPFTSLHREAHSRVWPVLFRWHGLVEKYHLVNSYGLFRSMTGVGGRPEVNVEASFSSDSGWQQYEFHHKPTRLDSSPNIIVPHQPRVDWQMWFAALGNYNDHPWFVSFAYRLLKNQKEVTSLLAHNPFPKDAPKFVRAVRYKYHFTAYNVTKRKKNPHYWWRRKKVGIFMPVISKDNTTVIQYLKQLGIIETKKSQQVIKSRTLKRILESTRNFAEYVSAQSFIWSLFFTALAIKTARATRT